MIKFEPLSSVPEAKPLELVPLKGVVFAVVFVPGAVPPAMVVPLPVDPALVPEDAELLDAPFAVVPFPDEVPEVEEPFDAAVPVPFEIMEPPAVAATGMRVPQSSFVAISCEPW